MEQNKCESLKMKHAWENTTPNIVYPTYPPQYPSKQETCANCGLRRTFREKVESWIEYSDGKTRTYEHENGSITLTGDLTSGSGTTNLNVNTINPLVE